jgi:dehydrogenase/reductase SDR family member 7B
MFKDKVIWITGASSGIGEALAKQMAKAGADLILSGRNVAALEHVAAACGGTNPPLILPFETTDTAALPDLVDRAWAHFGRVDVLINNAGISQRSLAVDTAPSVYQQIVDVDLLAPISLTQLVLPRMAAQRSGRFVFISSVAGKVGVPLRTAYCAAKHGLIGYADALRSEVAGLGIDVHVIIPGSVQTNVSRNALNADGSRRGVSDSAIDKGIPADKAAARMIRAMERGEREIIVARGLERAMPRLRRLSPNKLFDMMAGLMAAGYAQKMKS